MFHRITTTQVYNTQIIYVVQQDNITAYFENKRIVTIFITITLVIKWEMAKTSRKSKQHKNKMNLFCLQQMSCRNPTATILVELKKVWFRNNSGFFEQQTFWPNEMKCFRLGINTENMYYLFSCHWTQYFKYLPGTRGKKRSPHRSKLYLQDVQDKTFTRYQVVKMTTKYITFECPLKYQANLRACTSEKDCTWTIEEKNCNFSSFKFICKLR